MKKLVFALLAILAIFGSTPSYADNNTPGGGILQRTIGILQATDFSSLSGTSGYYLTNISGVLQNQTYSSGDGTLVYNIPGSDTFAVPTISTTVKLTAGSYVDIQFYTSAAGDTLLLGGTLNTTNIQITQIQ